MAVLNRSISSLAVLVVAFAASSTCLAQVQAPASVDKTAAQQEHTQFIERQKEIRDRDAKIKTSEQDGVPTRLKDIARFRGIRSNTLTGVGLVMGLEGSGDSKKYSPTAAALANYFKKQGFDVDPTQLEARNVALVMVTAELPPFAVNGQRLDVTVTSMGDAKSLRDGTLLMTALHAAGNPDTVYATATGPVSVGGYSVGQSGNSQSKGFVTVGRIPGGGIVEQGAPTTTIYDGKLYLELDDPDLTTAHRVEQRINSNAPEFQAYAEDGGTIRLTLPSNMTPISAMAKLEEMVVQSDTAATVIINEKTGTIVMGGNVRIAPVAIATGSISVEIEEKYEVTQPEELSRGRSVIVPNTTVSASEDNAQIAVVPPNTTVADLARIFQELKLKPSDIINILQLMKQQGALKAKLVIQ